MAIKRSKIKMQNSGEEIVNLFNALLQKHKVFIQQQVKLVIEKQVRNTGYITLVGEKANIIAFQNDLLAGGAVFDARWC